LRRLLLIALVLAACAPSAGTTTTSVVGEEVVVRSVTDGDTFEIQGDRVRLIGINAPERDECWGEESTVALSDLLGESAVLTYDVERRDPFGRLLAYVWTTDGAFVNRAMAAGGHALARAYEPNTTKQEELESAEEKAEDSGAGLWSACAAAGTAESVRITDYEANPPGPDEDDLNGEWVMISNVGDDIAGLEGWRLRDESSGNRFTFDEVLLEPGESVTVFTGCGTGTDSERYWCSDSPVWNNAGDTIFLLDAAGLTVDMLSYGS
jgi:micrococcal nuclease